MAEERTLLVLAKLGRENRGALLAEAAAAAYDLRFVESLPVAAVAIATTPPAAVIVDLGLGCAAALCEKVRSKRRSQDIALFGLAQKVEEEAFALALTWGVDDVVCLHTEGGLCTRLMALPADRSVALAARGNALVALPTASQANLVSRTLTNAGFEVELVDNVASIPRITATGQIRLVVVSAETGRLRESILETQAHCDAPWVILGRVDQIPPVEQSILDLGGVATVCDTDPMENLLFLGNELSADRGEDARAAPRMLHGGLIAFSSEDRARREYGFTYNVSPGGLYVRTLAVPVTDQVDLATRAPGTTTEVSLEGQIVWRRGFGRLGTATAPAGFAVRITGGPPADLEAWTSACWRLAKQRVSRLPSEPSEALVSLPPTVPPDDKPSTPEPDPPPMGLAEPQHVARLQLERRAVSAAIVEEFAAGRRQDRRREATPLPAPPGARQGSTGQASAGQARDLDAPPRAPASRSWGAHLAVGALVACVLIAVAVLAFQRMSSTGLSPARDLAADPLEDEFRTAGREQQARTVIRPQIVSRTSLSADPSTAEAPQVGPSPPITDATRGTSAAAPEASVALNPAEIEAPEPHAAVVSRPTAAAESGQDAGQEDLLSFEAYLFVESNADTGVFAHGIQVGRTNSRLKVHCGLKHLRLGDSPGNWRSEGAAVNLPCGQLTRVSVPAQ